MHSAAQFLRGCANAHGRPLPSPIKNYPPRPPALAPRFIVKPSGGNNFALIKRATGKIIIERFGHNNATGHVPKQSGAVSNCSESSTDLGITHRNNNDRHHILWCSQTSRINRSVKHNFRRTQS